MVSSKTLHLWGLSHQVAPISIREKIFFSENEIAVALKKMIRNKAFSEIVLISTCNRTEYYIVSEGNADIKEKIENTIKVQGSKLPNEISELAYYLKGQDAMRHLFKVTTGIDSMILGETQILGQAKRAYFLAQKTGTVNIYLNKLFASAIRVSKKIRNETPIGEGSMSIAYAAVELVQKVFKNLKEKKGLLIGAGNIGELTAKNLQKKSIKKMYLINRTFSKAKSIADQIGAVSLPWEKLSETLSMADFIISSTDQSGYIIDQKLVEEAKLHQKVNPILLIDIAVPRDIDPSIKEFENIFLHDIDDLNHIVEDGTTKRKEAIPTAMEFIQNEMKEFMNWSNYLKVRPTLVALREKLDGYARIEASKYRKKMEAEQIQYLEEALKNLTKKMLSNPAKKLKEYSNGYLDGDIRIEVIQDIFELEKTKKS